MNFRKTLCCLRYFKNMDLMGDNVEIDLEDTGYEGMVWFQEAKVCVHWQTWKK